MKIVDKTKALHYIWSRLSITVNLFIACLFLFLKFPEIFEWWFFAFLPLAVLGMIYLPPYDYSKTSNFEIISEYIAVFFLSIVMTVIAFVIIGILCGILLILAMLLEGCVIPIIQNRYRIINKIKAHMKRNNSKKQH